MHKFTSVFNIKHSKSNTANKVQYTWRADETKKQKKNKNKNHTPSLSFIHSVSSVSYLLKIALKYIALLFSISNNSVQPTITEKKIKENKTNEREIMKKKKSKGIRNL